MMAPVALAIQQRHFGCDRLVLGEDDSFIALSRFQLCSEPWFVVEMIVNTVVT
jgi:hypothetical protein